MTDSRNTDIRRKRIREAKKKRIRRKKIRMLEKKMARSILTGTIVFSCINVLSNYGTDIMYNLFDRNNIYYDNSLKLDPEETESLSNELESEIGVNIDNNDLLVLNAIKVNNNLNDSQKDFFYDYCNLIKDNPYLDKDEIYRSFLNLSIDYCDRPSDVDSSVQGTYSRIKKKISVFEDDPSGVILRHEGIHAIFSNRKSDSLPLFFSEGMTELLSNEYFSTDPFYEDNHYPYAIGSVKMLCEAVSEDKVLQAFSTGDMSIITDCLACSIGEKNSKTIIDIMENAFDFNQGTGALKYDLDTIDSYMELLGNCNSNRGLTYNEEVSSKRNFLYNKEIFDCMFSTYPAKSYGDYIVNAGVCEKAYFNSNLKEQFSQSSMVSYYYRDFVNVKKR